MCNYSYGYGYPVYPTYQSNNEGFNWWIIIIIAIIFFIFFGGNNSYRNGR